MGSAKLRKRVAMFAVWAAVGLFGSLASAPATRAQEDEDRRGSAFSWFVSLSDGPKLGVWLGRTEDGEGTLLVDRVRAGGPAEEAGIEAGDVIVSIDGHDLGEPLEDEAERFFARQGSLPEHRLRALVSEVPEGESVEVTVDRDGEILTFTVVPERQGLHRTIFATPTLDTVNLRLREMRDAIRSRYEDVEVLRPSREGRSGLTIVRTPRVEPGDDWRFDLSYVVGDHGLDLVELNPGLGAYFGTTEGVLVADARDDSPLALLPGDVVVEVEGRKVDDAGELRRILRSYAEDEEIQFRIWRDGAETTVVGTINRP